MESNAQALVANFAYPGLKFLQFDSIILKIWQLNCNNSVPVIDLFGTIGKFNGLLIDFSPFSILIEKIGNDVLKRLEE
jgi:hypothetical protein